MEDTIQKTQISGTQRAGQKGRPKSDKNQESLESESVENGGATIDLLEVIMEAKDAKDDKVALYSREESD